MPLYSFLDHVVWGQRFDKPDDFQMKDSVHVLSIIFL